MFNWHMAIWRELAHGWQTADQKLNQVIRTRLSGSGSCSLQSTEQTSVHTESQICAGSEMRKYTEKTEPQGMCWGRDWEEGKPSQKERRPANHNWRTASQSWQPGADYLRRSHLGPHPDSHWLMRKAVITIKARQAPGATSVYLCFSWQFMGCTFIEFTQDWFYI